jgi:hypothetical protein
VTGVEAGAGAVGELFGAGVCAATTAAKTTAMQPAETIVVTLHGADERIETTPSALLDAISSDRGDRSVRFER